MKQGLDGASSNPLTGVLATMRGKAAMQLVEDSFGSGLSTMAMYASFDARRALVQGSPQLQAAEAAVREARDARTGYRGKRDGARSDERRAEWQAKFDQADALVQRLKAELNELLAQRGVPTDMQDVAA
jgi:hypothetical protein